MALSSAEIESLRRYLGYPAGAQYKTELTNRCTEVLDTFSEATIRGHLRQLDRLQQQMTNVVPFAAETFNSGAGGTRQYGQGQRMATLHLEANGYIDEIAATIRLGIYRRIYPQGGGSRTIRG